MRSPRPARRIALWSDARRLLGPSLLGAALALTTGPARGEEPKIAGDRRGAEDAAAQPLLVMIVAERASSPLEERAAELVAAHVRSAGVTLKLVQRPAGSADTAARIADARAVAKDEAARGVLWVVSDRPDQLVLYLLAKEGGRVFRRSVPAPRAQTSAALEVLANIAGSAAAELMVDGRVVTMTSLEVAGADIPPAPTPDSPAPDTDSPPAPAAEAAPAPPPPPATPPPATPAIAPVPPAPRPDGPAHVGFRRLLLSAGYTGGTFASAASWQSAVALSASWAPAPNARIGLGYEVILKQHIEGGAGSALDVDLYRHPIVLSGGYRFLFGGRWDVDLGARSTVDIVARHPHPTGSSPPSNPLRHAIDPLVSLAPTVGLGFRIVDWLRVGAWAGVDVPLNRLSTTHQDKVDMQTDAARFLGGLDLQVGLIEPAAPRPSLAGK